jgi:hypothetical protein
MPWTCFSYSPDVPPGPGELGAVQPTLLGTRRMPLTCYSYPLSCFSYPDDMPSAIGNREAAQAVLPGLRRMPYSHAPPGPHRMTTTACFKF